MSSWLAPVSSGIFLPLGSDSAVAELPATFHAALILMLRSDTKIQSYLGSPARIYKEWPGAKARLPYVVVENYVEEQPGEALDLQVLSAILNIRALTQAETTAIGRRLRKIIDTPSQSDDSERPYALQWADGQETACVRQSTPPPMRLPRTIFGVDAFGWTLSYEFHYAPTGQAG